MTIALCSACGTVMKRYTTECARCTQTALEYFRSPDSERLYQRIKQITGRSPHRPNQLMSGVLVMAVAVAITVAIGWKDHKLYFMNQINPALQAAAPSAVPH